MELKRILAKDIRHATEKAVALYGKDVLFVSNARVNGMTEVIVAVEVEAEVAPATKAPARLSEGLKFESVLNHSFKALENGATASPAPQIDLPASTGKASAEAEDGLSLEADQRDYLRGREIVDLVRDELAAIRKEFKLAQRVAMWQNDASASPAVRPLIAALAEAGIPVSLRTLLVDHISELDDLEQAKEALQAHLTQSIGEHPVKLPQSGVHAIAGPAGAGKTLMVARLARGAAERKGADSVAVISYRDQRAGAWSQIQMLCAQSGVDCLRANDADTLKLLLGELGGKKLILIDTPGVEVASRVAEINACGNDIAAHLVLPADASATTARKYLLDPGLQWASLMATRLDESTQPWALIQLLCEHPQPISAAAASPLATASLKALSARDLVAVAIKSLALEAAPATTAQAQYVDETALSVVTAAEALVQRIEKSRHAS